MKRSIIVTGLVLVAACSKRDVESPVQQPISSLIETTVSVPPTCPSGMIEIEGEYCPEVEQTCLLWLDPDNKGANGPVRCAEFKQPTVCKSAAKVHKHFCIDKFEYPNVENVLPQTRMTYYEAKAACESGGKRLCEATEHTFACEGKDMHPYPYGDGFHRDSTMCNIDNKQTGDPEKSAFEVLDQRVPSGVYARCESPFGVRDIVGNVDEWVYNSKGRSSGDPYFSGLKGGHWVEGARNRCRPMTTIHGPTFTFYVTGTRCCANAK